MVVLPTGVGKTLVAALVVAHMRRLNPSKWVVFLTETCPLAEQQGMYLRTELTASATGALPSVMRSDGGSVQVRAAGDVPVHGVGSLSYYRAAAVGDVVL